MEGLMLISKFWLNVNKISLNANKISLNAKKAEFIVFQSKSKFLYSSCHLKLQGTRIYPSKSVKYLIGNYLMFQLLLKS